MKTWWPARSALVWLAVLGACDANEGGVVDGGGLADARPDIGRDSGRPGGRDAGPPPVAVCGDGFLSPGEVCDDGNTVNDDGCDDCTTITLNYVCVAAGRACVRIETCGNARIEGAETCDDRNTQAGDGCSATCQREPGWVCPAAGRACTAARCGDGVVAGFEICDDGGRCDSGRACTSDDECVAANDGTRCAPRANDGCSAACDLEEGYACPTAGAACVRVVCGNGVREGSEECDDGNPQIGDGCTPFCHREPDCTNGTCVAVCGDEVVFAPETCDDGNTVSGDGCDSSCQVERGYTCTQVAQAPPPSVTLPVVIRDFIPACQDGNDAVRTRPRSTDRNARAPYGHWDFQCYNGGERGMVGTMLVDGRPVRMSGASKIHSDTSFALWYRSNDDYNRTVVQRMTLGAAGGGNYVFDSSSFYPLSSPIDGSAPSGFPVENSTWEALTNDSGGAGLQNFHFTSEVRFWFTYEGTETLAFSGDDDVWVFINERLAVDIGGVHGREDGSITLADCANADPAMNRPGCLAPLDLRVGGIYEAVVFQAERHTSRSQYRLTLSNFERAPSVCRSQCGDEVIASNEACDDGAANGAAYDGCTSQCELAPFCGDGILQAEFGEICDDGMNLGGGPSACAPGCRQLGARCGDGVTQVEAGERCDDGNSVSGDGCSGECQFELL